MKRVGFYEAFDIWGEWHGTATLSAITKAGLIAGRFLGYELENIAVKGWACRPKRK